MRESAIQSAVLKYLRYHPKVAWVERMNVGATKVGDRFIRFGKPGMCDITGQLKNGRRLEVEIKQPSGRVSDDQKMFIAMVNIAGGLAFVARSIADVEAELSRA